MSTFLIIPTGNSPLSRSSNCIAGCFPQKPCRESSAVCFRFSTTFCLSLGSFVNFCRLACGKGYFVNIARMLACLISSGFFRSLLSSISCLVPSSLLSSLPSAFSISS
eukprot:TRINITY_DN1075_c0_g1_i4.p1 TRINITY_DN1075_c0_g1~~TRINITY_DN1075_c0_g1_i4.p1  ORF type:complete len:108 (-),score=14.35 TRINITY_DN1075_c0_g1_i4:190-513(-)